MATSTAKRRGGTVPARVIRRATNPIYQFMQRETSMGTVLVAVAAVAFIWANSPLAPAYEELKHIHVGVAFGDLHIDMSLHHWINDFLMVLFFFLVGLEIKRELLVGELAGWQRAALPCMGALGGMIAPALIYTAFNFGTENLRGWAVPVATDIAFAVGILALLGDRVPASLKVFLLALAIVDDLGAVVVIAVFYTDDLSVPALLISLGVWCLALLYGYAGGARKIVYLLIGLVMWYFMLRSGVHATIAGVLMAIAIPLHHGMDDDELQQEMRVYLEDGHIASGHAAAGSGVEHRVAHLHGVFNRAHSPLYAMEHALAPYVYFFIMPVFALFNAGVTVIGDVGHGAEVAEATAATAEAEGGLIGLIAAGAFFGLLLGKPIGICGAAWLTFATGMSRMPRGGNWTTFLGISMLAAIGFTMALFIANLAFGEGTHNLDQAKVGVLGASTVAAILGLFFLNRALPKRAPAGAGGKAEATGRQQGGHA